jgi:hypothetical protein
VRWRVRWRVGYLGCGSDVLRVHERHGVTKEQDVWGGQPGYDGVESGN